MQVSIDMRLPSGEEVIPIDGDLPVARLGLATRSGFRCGRLAHLLTEPVPDVHEPMDEDESALWERRGPADP